jgi:hypothetical protein
MKKIYFGEFWMMIALENLDDFMIATVQKNTERLRQYEMSKCHLT